MGSWKRIEMITKKVGAFHHVEMLLQEKVRAFHRVGI